MPEEARGESEGREGEPSSAIGSPIVLPWGYANGNRQPRQHEEKAASMKAKPEIAAEWMPLDALSPWAENPRRNDKAVAKVAESIKRFGFASPIIVREEGMEIIAGHTRWAAAKKLGLDRVPVRTLKLDPAEARLLALADNKLGEVAEWDDDQLRKLLAEVSKDDAELAGWGQDELDALMGEASIVEGQTDPDDAPEAPAVPRSVLGDVWLCGKHRVMCGDSTKAGDVGRLMAGAKADLLLTDPPYGIDYGRAGGFSASHGWGKWRENVEWDKERPSRETIESALSIAGEAIVCGGNYFTDYLPPSMGWLVWDKGQREFSLADCELAWRSERKAARVLTLSRAKALQDGKQHPTQKPIGLMSWCIEQANDPKTIYDPFLGSGTTLIAAEQLGRKCYGMEISPAYVDVIVKRWQDYTGKKATREADGVAFDEA